MGLNTKKYEVHTLDPTIDLLGVITSGIVLGWSFYILTLEKFRVMKNKSLVSSMVGVLILHVLINLTIIMREVLNPKFVHSGWKWPLLLHSIIVVVAIVWTIRSSSDKSREWCSKTYKTIFGILVGTSSIYFLSILLYGPASKTWLDFLQKKIYGSSSSKKKTVKN